MTVKTWLIEWFSKDQQGELDLNEDENLIDLGLLDSFKFILLIDGIESKFGVRLDWLDFFDSGNASFTIADIEKIISDKIPSPAS
tara:strand:- start:109 stop:363 length:255 start_codon:yes stop_codon:yes gene_type:complete